jgi:hypothetical protein
VSLKSLAGDQTLIHLFNSPESLAMNILFEFIGQGGSRFDIRFSIYNEENYEVNSGCTTGPSDQPLRALNTLYVITATYDAVTKVSKIYVDGSLRKQCAAGLYAAYGPRALLFSYLGQSSQLSKKFTGKIFRLAVYDRSLGAEEVVNQHQARKGRVAVATIALVCSSLYEFRMHYSAVNFSRVGLMVCLVQMHCCWCQHC